MKWRFVTLALVIALMMSVTPAILAEGPTPAPFTFTVSDQIGQMTEARKMRALIDLAVRYQYDWLRAPVLDEDGNVGMVQFSLIASHFGQGQDNENWDLRADLLPDGRINLVDLMVLGLSWGWNPDVNHDGVIQLIDMLMYVRLHLIHLR